MLLPSSQKEGEKRAEEEEDRRRKRLVQVFRPMPSTRGGHESFRFRSAVVDEDELVVSLERLGSIEENVTTSTSSLPVPLRPPTALMRLHRAVSSSVVTNDLRIKDENESGEFVVGRNIESAEEIESDAGCSIGCLVFQLKDNVDEESSPPPPQPPKKIQPSKPKTVHKRNAGPYTIIAFVNSASGGGMGNELFKSLQSHLGSNHVFDLHCCGPGNMPEDTLLKYAYDPMVRVLACGGDGTCGWIFSSLDKVWATVLVQNSTISKPRVNLSQYADHLPLAIMPLGTGNDLSRQFGWGGTFQSHMKKKSMIDTIQKSKITGLDRWRCIIIPAKILGEEDKEFIPKILGESIHATVEPMVEVADDSTIRGTIEQLKLMLEEDDTSKGQNKSQKKIMNMSEPSAQVFDGVFCNYFSLGFDATIAYLFHHEREMHPEKFTSPMKNKMVYVKKSPYALRAPKLRKRVQILVNNEKGQLEKLSIPKSCRAIILMNIQSYGGGNRLTKNGSSTDGVIEVVFVSNLIRFVGCAMAPVMPFLHFRIAAQTNNVCIRTRCDMHCQVDGEPWSQGEGVIQVKFHSRNSILEKIKDDDSRNCGCMSGSEEAAVQQDDRLAC
ncbi:hypothetical protein ACHAXR_006734 [Thalassiosira sp. AJA248-18]